MRLLTSLVRSPFRALSLGLGLTALVGLCLFVPGDAVSSGIGQTGHWEYIETTYSATAPVSCPEGLECWELCFVGVDGTLGTGKLCCVDQNGTCFEDLR